MPTYPLPTVAGQVTATGYSSPAIADIILSKVAQYQSIYGSDVLLQPDDQDYVSIAIESTAINDCNQLGGALYNAYSPIYAQGTGLSASVQTNGLKRAVATNSTALCQLIGQSGTIVQAGQVRDVSGNIWNLPALVTIPDAGQITVTATAVTAGAINTPAGAVTPYTIVAGWQSASFTSAATPGNPVEQDASLRKRQAQSTALPSTTPLDAIMAAVANSGGVARYQGYQNVGDVADANGIPAHGIAVVVEGGTSTAIATAIQLKKAPGTPMAGSTSVNLTDQGGLPVTIKYFAVTETPIYGALAIHPLTGYVSTTGTAAVQALVDFVNKLGIGSEVYINQLIAAASLLDSTLGQTFAVTGLTIGLSAGALAGLSIPIAFNAAASCAVANVTLSLT